MSSAADRVTERLDRAAALATREFDPRLAELLRGRVEAQLAGAPAPAAAGPLEEACAALADQFAVHVASVTEEQTEPVRKLAGDHGLYAVVCALYAFDAQARLRLARERLL